MCTDDAAVVGAYARAVRAVPGCAVVADFENEQRRLARRGTTALSEAHWLARCLLAAKLPEKRGVSTCCVHSRQGCALS